MIENFFCLWSIIGLVFIFMVVDCTGDCSEPSDVHILTLYKNLREGGYDVTKLLPINTTAHIIPMSQRSALKYPIGVCQCSSKDELTFDPLRIPKAIPQSPCLKHNHQKWGHYIAECRDVLYDMAVYRRDDTCVNNVYTYKLFKESIKVGCSCHVRPPVLSRQ